MIWTRSSPNRPFDEAMLDRAAVAFDNPDYANVVVHSYRHRPDTYPAALPFPTLPMISIALFIALSLRSRFILVQRVRRHSMLIWTRWHTGSNANDQQENVCEQVCLFSALHSHYVVKSLIR